MIGTDAPYLLKFYSARRSVYLPSAADGLETRWVAAKLALASSA